MLSTFGSIAQNVNLKPKLRTIDNVVFKLHYRFTFLVLVVCTVLVCSRQYVGEHIRCVSDVGGGGGDGGGGVIETYCFFSSTFTVVKHFRGEGGSHPGVGPYVPGVDAVRRHAYYQWVPFALFGQAVLFYLPHLLWRTLDGGTLDKMAAVLRGRSDLDDDRSEVRGVAIAFVDRLPYLERWARYLVLCEVLNLANVFAQVFLTDLFLGGRFLALGLDLVSGGPDSSSVLDEVFPKVTKCDFRKYGPSGTVQNHDALCVLALNVINEKIYVALWFWYATLAVASVLGLFWRAVTLCLHRRSVRFNAALFRCVSAGGAVDETTLQIVTNYLTFSQWLFLYYLGKNMDGFVYKRLLVAVADRLYGARGYSRNQEETDEMLLTTGTGSSPLIPLER